MGEQKWVKVNLLKETFGIWITSHHKMKVDIHWFFSEGWMANTDFKNNSVCCLALIHVQSCFRFFLICVLSVVLQSDTLKWKKSCGCVQCRCHQRLLQCCDLNYNCSVCCLGCASSLLLPLPPPPLLLPTFTYLTWPTTYHLPTQYHHHHYLPVCLLLLLPLLLATNDHC